MSAKYNAVDLISIRFYLTRDIGREIAVPIITQFSEENLQVLTWSSLRVSNQFETCHTPISIENHKPIFVLIY